jgi:hypothetical protein
MAAVRSRGRLADPLPEAPPTNDAYTGLLAVSLVAMIVGCVFLFLDYQEYSGKPPAPSPRPSAPAQGIGGGVPPAAGQPGGVQPGAVQPGGGQPAGGQPMNP